MTVSPTARLEEVQELLLGHLLYAAGLAESPRQQQPPPPPAAAVQAADPQTPGGNAPARPARSAALGADVLRALTAAVLAAGKARPENPLEFVGEWLLTGGSGMATAATPDGGQAGPVVQYWLGGGAGRGGLLAAVQLGVVACLKERPDDARGFIGEHLLTQAEAEEGPIEM